MDGKGLDGEIYGGGWPGWTRKIIYNFHESTILGD
jgi:hypothetical protein